MKCTPHSQFNLVGTAEQRLLYRTGQDMPNPLPMQPEEISVTEAGAKEKEKKEVMDSTLKALETARNELDDTQTIALLDDSISEEEKEAVLQNMQKEIDRLDAPSFKTRQAATTALTGIVLRHKDTPLEQLVRSKIQTSIDVKNTPRETVIRLEDLLRRVDALTADQTTEDDTDPVLEQWKKNIQTMTTDELGEALLDSATPLEARKYIAAHPNTDQEAITSLLLDESALRELQSFIISYPLTQPYILQDALLNSLVSESLKEEIIQQPDIAFLASSELGNRIISLVIRKKIAGSPLANPKELGKGLLNTELEPELREIIAANTRTDGTALGDALVAPDTEVSEELKDVVAANINTNEKILGRILMDKNVGPKRRAIIASNNNCDFSAIFRTFDDPTTKPNLKKILLGNEQMSGDILGNLLLDTSPQYDRVDMQTKRIIAGNTSTSPESLWIAFSQALSQNEKYWPIRMELAANTSISSIKLGEILLNTEVPLQIRKIVAGNTSTKPKALADIINNGNEEFSLRLICINNSNAPAPALGKVLIDPDMQDKYIVRDLLATKKIRSKDLRKAIQNPQVKDLYKYMIINSNMIKLEDLNTILQNTSIDKHIQEYLAIFKDGNVSYVELITIVKHPNIEEEGKILLLQNDIVSSRHLAQVLADNNVDYKIREFLIQNGNISSIDLLNTLTNPNVAFSIKNSILIFSSITKEHRQKAFYLPIDIDLKATLLNQKPAIFTSTDLRRMLADERLKHTDKQVIVMYGPISPDDLHKALASTQVTGKTKQMILAKGKLLPEKKVQILLDESIDGSLRYEILEKKMLPDETLKEISIRADTPEGIKKFASYKLNTNQKPDILGGIIADANVPEYHKLSILKKTDIAPKYLGRALIISDPYSQVYRKLLFNKKIPASAFNAKFVSGIDSYQINRILGERWKDITAKSLTIVLSRKNMEENTYESILMHPHLLPDDLGKALSSKHISPGLKIKYMCIKRKKEVPPKYFGEAMLSPDLTNRAKLNMFSFIGDSILDSHLQKIAESTDTKIVSEKLQELAKKQMQTREAGGKKNDQENEG